VGKVTANPISGIRVRPSRPEVRILIRLVATIERSEADWTVWFAAHSIVPCEVTYEELAADPPRTAQEVLDYLGLDVPPDRQLVVGHRRQADQLNADWITRFKSH
jgi:LPS sulfotransferase NodH